MFRESQMLRIAVMVLWDSLQAIPLRAHGPKPLPRSTGNRGHPLRANHQKGPRGNYIKAGPGAEIEMHTRRLRAISQASRACSSNPGIAHNKQYIMRKLALVLETSEPKMSRPSPAKKFAATPRSAQAPRSEYRDWAKSATYFGAPALGAPGFTFVTNRPGVSNARLDFFWFRATFF